MKNAKILIVDDEILITEDLKDTLALLDYKNVAMAHNKADARKQINEWQPDLVLLDIRMEKEKDGIELGYELGNTKIPFIYITAHSDLAMINEIISTKPVAYLTKPFNKTNLLTNISLILDQVGTNEPLQITVKNGTENVLLNIKDIVYVESESNYITIYCSEKRYVIRQSLDSFAPQLGKNFFKPQRGFLINLKKVTQYSKTKITLDGKAEIPLSRNMHKELEEALKNLV